MVSAANSQSELPKNRFETSRPLGLCRFFLCFESELVHYFIHLLYSANYFNLQTSKRVFFLILFSALGSFWVTFRRAIRFIDNLKTAHNKNLKIQKYPSNAKPNNTFRKIIGKSSFLTPFYRQVYFKYYGATSSLSLLDLRVALTSPSRYSVRISPISQSILKLFGSYLPHSAETTTHQLALAHFVAKGDFRAPPLPRVQKLGHRLARSTTASRRARLKDTQKIRLGDRLNGDNLHFAPCCSVSSAARVKCRDPRRPTSLWYWRRICS